MSHKLYFFWIFLFLLVVGRIVFYYTDRPKYSDGTMVRLSGRVMSEPIIYDYSQGVTLQGYKFYLPLYPEIGCGDVLSVEGRVEGEKLREVKVVSHGK